MISALMEPKPPMDVSKIMRRTTLVTITCYMLVSAGCVQDPCMRRESTLSITDIDKNAQHEQRLHIYSKDKTVGLFPTGIAVVRVRKQVNSEGSIPGGTLNIFELLNSEAAYWTELFDGTPEVLEVISLHQKSVRGLEVTSEELINAARIMNTNLLLVYGYDNVANPGACEVSGVLYDLATRKPLASIKHFAALKDAKTAAKLLPKHVTKPSTSKEWAFYTDFLAMRGFESQFKSCVWQLIDKDGESQTIQPNPFENPKPLYPNTWRIRKSN